MMRFTILPPILITENGCAVPDKVENGRVHDQRRIDFYQSYMKQVLKAKNEGVDIRGYFAWTAMDNFENLTLPQRIMFPSRSFL